MSRRVSWQVAQQVGSPVSQWVSRRVSRKGAARCQGGCHSRTAPAPRAGREGPALWCSDRAAGGARVHSAATRDVSWVQRTCGEDPACSRDIVKDP